VVLTHANVLEDLDHVNYWMTYKEGGVYLHAAPMFHIADLPFLFGAPAFGICQVTIPKFSAQHFCETVERERVNNTVLVPTMLSLLTQYTDLRNHNLTSLEVIGYGGSPISLRVAHGLVPPHLQTRWVYGLSETGYLTGLQDHEHTEERLNPAEGHAQGSMCASSTRRKEVETGQSGELVAEVRMSAATGRIKTRPNGRSGADWLDGRCRLSGCGRMLLHRPREGHDRDWRRHLSGEVEAVISGIRPFARWRSSAYPARNGRDCTACVVLEPDHPLSAGDLVACADVPRQNADSAT
jgi:acyl-CoA synthetase (AMP-forming)/AMP-acid ligase II